MKRLLPLVLMIVAGLQTASLAQGPYGYGPPGYGLGMPSPYYGGPPPGYYPPPPGYYPPMQPPPGYNPNVPPPGFNPNQAPPGYNPNVPPPGFNPSLAPPGFNPKQPPPGNNPSEAPGRIPYYKDPEPQASPLPPPFSSGPPGAGLPPQSSSPLVTPAPPSAQPLAPFGAPPGATQEPPLFRSPTSPASEPPGALPPPNEAGPVLPAPAETEQTPIPQVPNIYPPAKKDKSCPNCQKGGILPWYQPDYNPAAPPAAAAVNNDPWQQAPADPYPRDGYTFQMLGGYYQNLGSTKYQYMPIALRFGKLIDCPCLGCHGCFEPIIELNGAPTLQFGNAFVGAALFLRYNFVRPGCKVVPYAQVGCGVQYNDAYKDASQTALGQPVEYVGQAQFGLHWFVFKNISFDAEGGYMIFTNFNQSSRNDGIHGVGGSVGITYYFPTCRH